MASAVAPTSAFGAGSPLALGAASADSLESFPGAGKRSLGQSDGDDDHERPGHVKKRRKQSKPVRIAATDADEKASPAPTGGRRYLDFAETGEHFLTEGLAACREDARDGHDNYDSTLPLNLSSVKTPFAVTAADAGDGLSSSKHVPADGASQYHSREDAKTPVTQDNSYLSQSPSLLLPLFKQTQMQNQLSQITSQMRIFNPEAFCDLCNKEFCNKYFLKTHKANKHGIYTENQGPSLLDPLPTMAFTNYFSSNNDAYENPPVFQTAKPLLNQPSYLNVRSGTGVPKKAQPQQSQPQVSIPAAKSNSNGNTRALCNICQREFCNKYFVRRHKLKIHGIVETASKDGSNEAQENQSLNNNNTQIKTEMPSGDMDFFSGYGKHLNLSFNSDTKEEFQNVETNEENPKEKYDKEQEGDRQAVPSFGFSTQSENAFLQVLQHEENNKENNVSSVKLKKLGVINADAFCDICCKEYCNKYFLRTHKLKSHGIIPVEERKDETVSLNGATGNMPWCHQLQSSPLNLIVGETTTNRPDLDIQTPAYDTDPEESVCGECGRYFQSKFLLKMHQAYSHVNKSMTFDSVTLENSQNNNPVYDVSTNSEPNEENPQDSSAAAGYSPVDNSEYIVKDVDEVEDIPVTTNPEDVKKMQILIIRLGSPIGRENTVCDVCEKDVGHYSLMENHMLQAHYFLLEKIANMNGKDDSSNQSSHLVAKNSFECPHCQTYFLRELTLNQHIQQIHGDVYIMDHDSYKKSMDSNGPNKLPLMPFMAQSSEEKQSLQTPASSFCEICKKELCNKYFMKTHMQRMHGISIENGAQIGGVVCEICNKELCSKYFLRVHKQNSHGIVDELFLPQLDYYRNQSPNTDSALKPTDQSDLSNRYFTHFNEVCPICNRRFRSVKWLKAHLWNDHGEEGKGKCKDVFLPANFDSKPQHFDDNQRGSKKSNAYPIPFNNSNQLMSALNSSEGLHNGKEVVEKQDPPEKTLQNSTMFTMLMNGKDSESKHYQCSYCPFTTTILAFLFIHERSHSNARQYQAEQDSGQKLRCPVCFSTLDSKESYEKHLKLHTNSWQQPYGASDSMQERPGEPRKSSEMKIKLPSNREPDVRPGQEADVVSPSSAEERPDSARGDRPAEIGECFVRCTRCGFGTSSVQQYLEHVTREHPDAAAQQRTDRDLPAYLHQVERALSTLACNSGIPAVFAVPRRHDAVTMQPFVLEDSDPACTADTNDPIDSKAGKTFLSSLVYLPVKEKLKKTVTASFKLTPT